VNYCIARHSISIFKALCVFTLFAASFLCVKTFFETDRLYLLHAKGVILSLFCLVTLSGSQRFFTITERISFSKMRICSIDNYRRTQRDLLYLILCFALGIIYAKKWGSLILFPVMTTYFEVITLKKYYYPLRQ